MNAAIIGLGKMGRIRLANVENIAGCRVICGCDTTAREDVSFPVHANPEGVLNDTDVDAVFICTPNYLIKPLVIEALRAGKHVFAEKPPGMSLAEVHEMKACMAHYAGQIVKFGFNHRYHDAIVEAKRRIETGDYGDIIWMRGRYGKSVSEDYKEQWRAKREFAGGGIFLDQGIHMLDLFLHFCGDFDEVKSFCSGSYWDLGIEDNVFAMFRNNKGQTASLHSTMTQWRHLFALEIFMERGYMVVNGILSSSGAYTNGNGYEELCVALNRTPAPQAGHSGVDRFRYRTDHSFQREVDEFVRCVRESQPPRHGSIRDAEKLMRLVEMVYEDDERWNGEKDRETAQPQEPESWALTEWNDYERRGLERTDRPVVLQPVG